MRWGGGIMGEGCSGAGKRDHDRDYGNEDEDEDEGVPAVVSLTVGILRHRGLDEEGLFRVCGNAALMRKMQEFFQDPNTYKLSNEAQRARLDKIVGHDVHSLAGVLKKFLRDLASPIVPEGLYNAFILAGEITDLYEKRVCMRLLVKALPELNRKLMHYMVKFLRDVAAHCEKNRMTSENLAIVFGPSLLPGPADKALLHVNKLPVVIRSFIDDYQVLFEGQVITPPYSLPIFVTPPSTPLKPPPSLNAAGKDSKITQTATPTSNKKRKTNQGGACPCTPPFGLSDPPIPPPETPKVHIRPPHHRHRHHNSQTGDTKVDPIKRMMDSLTEAGLQCPVIGPPPKDVTAINQMKKDLKTTIIAWETYFRTHQGRDVCPTQMPCS
ncbi:rho GTPase-activating protein 9 [Pelomyxa schiedti]|nr:rho GTPase-activating protein 9 [Pelomyxa schiedti]